MLKVRNKCAKDVSSNFMKKVCTLLFFLVSIVSGAEEVPLDLRVNNYYEALMLSFEQKFRAKDTIVKWKDSPEVTEAMNSFDLTNCSKKPEDELLLILQVEEDGLIKEVYPSLSSEKSACFVKVFKGFYLPKPPMSPAYMLVRMV